MNLCPCMYIYECKMRKGGEKEVIRGVRGKVV